MTGLAPTPVPYDADARSASLPRNVVGGAQSLWPHSGKVAVPATARREGRRPRGRTPGFTLIELLVVLGMIAILAGLMFGGLQAGLATARRMKCAANLRSLATAAVAFAEENNGEFPWGLRTVDGYESYSWDFVVPTGGKPQPGPLWSGYGVNEVLQCPGFIGGKANWDKDPYTGYNYNVSYIGKVQGDPGRRTAPALLSQVEDAARTALFGDGQYEGGANKFMRAPKVRRDDPDCSGSGGLVNAGTQGFRHRGRTNIAFCDAHVEALGRSYQANGKEGFVAPGCGFVSPDNSLYSLKK